MIDRAEAYWAYRDPAYNEGRVVCNCCGCACDEDEAVQIDDEWYCPDCVDDVKADKIDWAIRHGIDPTSIQGIYEEDIEEYEKNGVD